MTRIIILILGLFLFGPTAPTHAEQIIVDAFGDSITSGYPYFASNGNGCLPPCGGYEPELQRLLNSSGRDSAVKNFGVGGETSSSGLSRIDGVLSVSRPRYVLLLEGTNELYYFSPSTVRTNMSRMAEKALASGVVPVLGTLTPDTRYPSKPIASTNSLLRELAAEKGIPLADLYSATASNWSALTADGLHPNLTGYKVMAQTWFNAIATQEQQGGNASMVLPAIYQLLLD